jgi:hypothetical protein
MFPFKKPAVIASLGARLALAVWTKGVGCHTPWYTMRVKKAGVMTN